MGCSGRHLALFLLLCSTTFPTSMSFSEYVRAEPLYRFWEVPSYFPNNPYVSDLAFFKFYSYAFDGSANSIGLEGIMPMGKEQLLSYAPPGQEAAFSQPSSSLSLARTSAISASNATIRAHSLSLASQQAAESLLGTEQLVLLTCPHPIATFTPVSAFFRIPAIVSYILEYPGQYSFALSSAADAYDSTNAALLWLAKKTDEKRDGLLLAGAGKPHYSGRGKAAFLEAESLLAENSQLYASTQQASAISAYFLSSPDLHNFSKVGFFEYISRAAGNGTDSTMAILARTYGALLAADAQMETEYQTAHALALTETAALSFQVSRLKGQKLDLIGDAPQFLDFEGNGGPNAVASSSFSGIISGLNHAQEELLRAKSLISSSESLHKSKTAEGFLADAIAQSESASQAASVAKNSLLSVESNAEAAVFRQKESAQNAIFFAEMKANASIMDFNDAKATAKARNILNRAIEEFASAGRAQTLGSKFSAYSNSAQSAKEATLALDGKARLPFSDSALLSISALEEAIAASEKDGVHADYEKEKLLEYKKLVSSADSQEALLAIQDAAIQDKKNVWASLSYEYADLSSAYLSLFSLVNELRTEDQSLISGFDSISRYFDEDGNIQMDQAAGHLREASLKIASYGLQAQERLPAHIGWLLSNNALVFESSKMPKLGVLQNFSATISTRNPSTFSYNGSVTFSAMVSLPLYSAEKTDGDRLSDAYPDGKATRITIPGASALQSFSFSFSKANLPAQITSSSESCGAATEAEARLIRKISFFAPRSLPILGIEELVAEKASQGSTEFGEKQVFLQAKPSGTSENYFLFGELQNVPQGKNTIEISYAVESPFSVSIGEKSFVSSTEGRKLATFEITIANATVECDSALVETYEPFVNITGFSAVANGGQKVSQARAVPSPYGTKLSFSLFPLRKGSNVRIQASYQIEDLEGALAAAFSQAEIGLAYHNTTTNTQLLLQARELASQGRSSEALIILSTLKGRMDEESRASAESFGFQRENASASSQITDAAYALSVLLDANATLQAAKLSSTIDPLRQSSSLALTYFSEGNYKKALDTLRKAQAKFSADLSELSWAASEQASKDYAAARKLFSSDTSTQIELEPVSASISASQRKFAQGDILESFIDSSLASVQISGILSIAATKGANASREAETTRDLFETQKKETESLLAGYSSQYSALSGQTKKKLVSPSFFSEQISSAEKGMAAAFKSSNTPQVSMQQANLAYGSLLATKQSIEGSVASLRLSAETSLRVAQAALSEVRQKTGEGFGQEGESIEEEVEKAESFLSDSFYSDSLLASDRAIRASNLLLQKTGKPLDAQAIAIAAVSVIFISGAAGYFLIARGKGGKKEARELPKEESK